MADPATPGKTMTIHMTSRAFQEGRAIPRQYACGRSGIDDSEVGAHDLRFAISDRRLKIPDRRFES